MYRKIMGFLEAWKENEHRKPLILQGLSKPFLMVYFIPVMIFRKLQL